MKREGKYSGNKMVGEVFGRLTILENLGVFKKHRKVRVKCECGVEYDIKLDTLICGHSKSCGCLQKELAKNTHTTHGLSQHPLRGVHRAMIDRCYKKTDPNYKNYGAVGVIVCDEWVSSFQNFAEWSISHGWEVGLTLDKDKLYPGKTGKIYSPEFCCFLTNKENNQYRSNNRLIEFNGENLSVSQWADRFGIKYSTFHDRLTKGWLMEDIIGAEVPQIVYLPYNGEMLTALEWSKRTGINISTFRLRIKKGWSVEKIINTPINENLSHKKKRTA